MATETRESDVLAGTSLPIEFPAGLIGLEEWKRFELISHPEGGPLRLLQSLDDERLSLIVTDPRDLVRDYKIVLSDAEAEFLECAAGEQSAIPAGLEVYCILSVSEEPLTVTANLLGPLVINPHAGRGRQVILSQSGYSSRHPVAGGAAVDEESSC